MALNPEFVGKQYPDTAPYLIGREKVREFATAIGEQSPCSTTSPRLSAWATATCRPRRRSPSC